ncbi:divalent metal cation transporter [Sphingomonas sp. H39-1-10]|uniref:NRAMP family divalent metal transporter n=1 Tax=Sphingomonas pollutisoli TaxID=3030829 RepID=UPI0023B8ECEC|nr:divalent metal cation transporter [Sphingomonas pollutisoli]MDF0487587.1 divalent metal cation transporter [Sphingomonas pollutisoli]
MPIRPVALLRELGPGLVTGAADDDPSGIATYSQAGAQCGFTLLWTLVLTYPLMSAIQLVSAHIGRVTGRGLAGNMRQVLPLWTVDILVALLFVANTINVGADIAAMGEAGELVTGISGHATTILFAVVSLLLQLFVPYHRYAHILKWLTLALLSYVALLFVLHLDWGAVATGLVLPRVTSKDAVVTIVAVFGTTISPYLFFWQSAQEVEEIAQHPDAHPLVTSPEEAPAEMRRMRFDTLAGMAVSNIVAIAIMIGTAATLHASGVTSITTAADAARALSPIAGRFAFLLFSLGIIGTGLLAVPVLAGSAAYAVGDLRGWPSSLERKPREAIGFYSIITAATVLGIVIDWSPIDPTRALFWSAVINGVVAVPLMAAMMIVVSRRAIMGAFRAAPSLLATGWAATIVMAAAALAMVLVQ